MQELQDILENYTVELENNMIKTLNQLVLETATDLLSRLEKILGITTDVNKSYKLRRESIKARLSTIGTATKQMMVDTIKSYNNGEITITEDTANYKLIVTFISHVGVPKNMKSLKDDIDSIKPAHLVIEYNYLYNAWDMLISANHTWEYYTGQNKTWEEMKSYS